MSLFALPWVEILNVIDLAIGDAVKLSPFVLVTTSDAEFSHLAVGNWQRSGEIFCFSVVILNEVFLLFSTYVAYIHNLMPA